MEMQPDGELLRRSNGTMSLELCFAAATNLTKFADLY